MGNWEGSLDNWRSFPVSKKRKWLVQSIGIIISVACIIFIARQVTIQELKLALLDFNWHYIVLGICSLSIGYMLRIVRWGIMLRAADALVRNIQCAVPFLGSIALNNVLPLRAGDLVRAFIFPASMGVRVATSTASLVLERLLDLLTLLLYLSAGIYLSEHVSLPAPIKSGVLLLAIFVFSAFIAMFAFHKTSLSVFKRFVSWADDHGYQNMKKAFLFITEFFKRLTEMLGPKNFICVFLLSLGVWVFEAGLFMAILEGMHLSVSLIDAIGIMAITTLATLVPSSPGYVGPFHIAAYSALATLNVSVSDAANFAIVAHLALWLPTTFAGAVAILCNRHLFQGISTGQNA
jgi:uncharacterized protein (TIRG00374 family)